MPHWLFLVLIQELKVLLSLSWCAQHKSSALYIQGFGYSLIFHVWQNYGTFRDRGLSGKQKSTSKWQINLQPWSTLCVALTHYNAGDKFWNEHWSKVISQRTPAPHSTAKPLAKFFFSRHISGNLPVCLQGTSVNVRAKSQMNVEMCKQKRSFFLLLSCGTASKVTGCFFSHFISPGMFFFVFSQPSASIPISHKQGCLDTADFHKRPKHLSVARFEYYDS